MIVGSEKDEFNSFVNNEKTSIKKQNFMEINLSFDYYFCFTVAGRCVSMSFWKHSYVFMRYRKGTTAQKMKFSIKDLFSKCEQIRSLLRIWSHLLKKSVMENFIFCVVNCGLKWVNFSVNKSLFHK